MAAGIRHNMAVSRNWAGPARTVDAFDAKADALAVLGAIGAPIDNMSAQAGAPDWFHPGRSGVIRLGDRVMAHFGELHPEIVATADLSGPVAAFGGVSSVLAYTNAHRGSTASAGMAQNGIFLRFL